MTEPHGTEADHGPSMNTYLAVFGGLVVFTAVSFVVYELLGRGSMLGFAIILAVAVCKATLVGTYFMHLILDFRKLFVLIVPALVLGPMLVVVLWPDIVLAWQRMYAMEAQP